MAQINDARFVMVKATMTVQIINLVVPLASNATAMRITETAGLDTHDRSGAVRPMIGASLRRSDVDSTAIRFGL